MSIQGLIDQKIRTEQESRSNRQPSGKISPSGLGRCFRYQYWQRKGEKPSNPPDERTLRVFRAGDLFHDFVQELIPDKQVEVFCEKDDIRGYCDIVTSDSCIDIKSVHSFAFHHAKKDGYDVYKEKFTNWLQVCCYAYILGKSKIGLVMISKDDLCINEYWCPTEKFMPFLMEELTIIREIWSKDYLPPALPRCYIDKNTGKPKECAWCSFYDKCEETK